MENSWQFLSFFDDPATRAATVAERAFLGRLEGGCVVPVAGLGRIDANRLTFEALIGDLDGKIILRDRLVGPPAEAETLGRTLAETLLTLGGQKILDQLFGPPI